jgi:septum formation protein
MATPRLILASASPRRRELLQQLALDFSIAEQNIDEIRRPAESAREFVQRMAHEKADSALLQLDASAAAAVSEIPDSETRASATRIGETVVIAADTVVLCDAEVLGKPTNQDDALRMMRILSDREHRVLSAITVANSLRRYSAISETRVSFRAVSAAEARWYWHTGEPQDKAGGYAIQGYGAIFVKTIKGSYSGVMGLPLFETAQFLREFDIDCLTADGVEI